MDETLAVIQAGRATSVTCVEGPPPFFEESAIRERFGLEPHFERFAEVFKLDLATAPISAFPMRLALWYLLRDVKQEICRKHGVRFVCVPDELRDEHGGLRADLVADVTHGNRLFGASMWPEILRDAVSTKQRRVRA